MRRERDFPFSFLLAIGALCWGASSFAQGQIQSQPRNPTVPANGNAPEEPLMEATTFDQKLEKLYRTMSGKFKSNPHFRNESHPDLSGVGSRDRPAEYTMPSPDLFKTAMKSYCSLMESPEGAKVSHPEHFTFVNYSEHALNRRMYVFDFQKKEVLHQLWATHGIKSTLDLELSLKDTDSGEEDAVFSKENAHTSSFFSNVSGSNQSSTGMAVFYSNTYNSPTFNSLAVRMDGVDGDLNDHLLERAIVVHAFDYKTLDIAQHDLPTSEGCLMLQRSDFYKGRSRFAVSDNVIPDLLGSPILLYSERMRAAENEKEHRKQLEMAPKIQSQMEAEYQRLADFYKWSPAQSKKYLDQLSEKLKAQLMPRIEQTYQYFKTASKFVDRPLKSEAQCLKVLGID